MRILYFGDTRAEHLRRWSRHFAALGHDVHVITWASDGLSGFEPVIVHELGKVTDRKNPIARGIVFVQMMIRSRGIISAIQADIFHAHSAGAYAWLPMFLKNRPFVISPWGNDVLIDIHSSFMERHLTALALKSCDKVHCDGENTKEAVVRLGVKPEDVVLASFGVDVDKFKRTVPRDHAGTSAPLHVVSTRTLNPVHDVETLLKAVPQVLRRVPDTRFVIAGGGAESHALRKLAGKLGVDQQVVFKGHLEESEMVACLQNADIYVSTSLSESGLAASTAEAMACELPVINTDTGDIRKWVQDGNGGFVVPVQRPDIVADKIVFLCKHPELRRAFGVRNREVIVERNNVYVEMKRIEEVYENLVHRIRTTSRV